MSQVLRDQLQGWIFTVTACNVKNFHFQNAAECSEVWHNDISINYN